MTRTFPLLYKKTSTGAIQTWCISVVGETMYSESGQIHGKKTKSQDTIREGKNIGKANETTPAEQAVLEATSRWTGKKKKKYVESLVDAQSGVTSTLVEGGYDPTLAHVYEKKKKYIKFPCASQPKLDGMRNCWSGGSKNWSRTRKEIISVPHIAKFCDEYIDFPKLDGELYNHDYRDNFEAIMHIVNQKKTPTEDHEIVQYHVYDIPSEEPFRKRMEDLELLRAACYEWDDCPIVVVETVICKNEEELMAYREKCLEAGYEGSMVRNLDAPYEHKRSNHLQKLKIMEDAEFKIVGVEEGRGKLTGHAGAFVCLRGEEPSNLLKAVELFLLNKTQPENGAFFKAKLKGKLPLLKKYFVDFRQYRYKKLTVQFQGYTNKNNVPRFPVALRIREEE